jgi:tetratricopeptide (TPR) repeat protein
MSRVDKRLIFGVAALLIIFSAMNSYAAVASAEDECDVAADIALQVGDYVTAIRRHQNLLLSDWNNALAHYHLGFAYGMAGLTAEEIGEYRTAIALGLKKWDLFLNLGLAYADRHEPERAIEALETAVSLGPEHAETHFNLAVMYEQQNRLDEALQQIITSLVLNPRNSGGSYAQFERESIIHALQQAHGNKLRAAKTLRISRKKLYNRISRYGLNTEYCG